MASQYNPLVRHDTGVTISTYDDEHKQYGAISKAKKEMNVDYNDSLSSSDQEDVEACKTFTTEQEGILYFPGLNNTAYVVNPMSKSDFRSNLVKTLEAIPGKYVAGDLKRVSNTSAGIVKKRFITTAEVIIAKLFLAGFFWQTFATLCGYEDDTFAYAITTGIGEATGVFLGNCLYDVFKKILVDESINLLATIQTSIWLATATVCSGTSWQPVVNLLKSMELSFMGVFVGTWICCTYAFNFGLRVGRNLYFKKLEHVEKPTWENSRTDFALSLTIGGATAFFVGTDTSFSPDVNFLYHIVGIQDSMSPLAGAVAAGTSTALGFGFTQAVFNIIYPEGECWID